ncbi:MAG: DNA internalization-related competence protein ComEC/Rec2 [Bacilli bacterium]|nr:DNA internalization-related competence protein ComEC/Rec2 [Bacilli bacterium]
MQEFRLSAFLKNAHPIYLFLGLVIGSWLSYEFWRFPFFIVLAALIIVLVLAIYRKKGNSLLFLLSCALGFGLNHLQFTPPKGYQEIEGVVVVRKNNYYFLRSGFYKYYVYEKSNTREVGDVLFLKGKVEEVVITPYESRFDFKEYLRSQKVSYSITFPSIEEKWNRPVRLREYERKFLSSFSSEASSLLDGLLFGNLDYSSNLVVTSSEIGAIYLLSTSGLLFGALTRGVGSLLNYTVGDNKKSKIISFLFSSFLLVFLYKKVGVWRSYLTKNSTLAYKWMNKSPPRKDYLLSYIGIILFVLMPSARLSTGLLISFGLSFFLYYSSTYLNLRKGKKKKIFSYLSLISFLFPVFISSHAIHLFSPIYSLFLLPLIYPYAAIGYISFLSVPFTSLLNAYSSFLSNVIYTIKTLDIIIPLGEVGPLYIALYYLLFLSYFFFADLGIISFKRGILGTMALGILVNILPLNNLISAEVTFINVGQGDAILIRDHLSSVLIDTGGVASFDVAEEVDIPFLRKKRIYKLDAIIASHGDFDHVGGVESLVKNYQVERLITKASEFPLKIGNLYFENYNIWGESSEDENEKSLVLGLSLMGKRWLFTGDAGVSTEKKIIDEFDTLDCDILKLGHHGSKTSSSLEFLKKVTPEVAIISCGLNNKYGHPHQEVLTRLDSLKIPYRRTDEEGSITYQSYFPFLMGK